MKILNYLLRDIPEELWAAAHARAAQEHVSIRIIIFQALRAYLGL